MNRRDARGDASLTATAADALSQITSRSRLAILELVEQIADDPERAMAESQQLSSEPENVWISVLPNEPYAVLWRLATIVQRESPKLNVVVLGIAPIEGARSPALSHSQRAPRDPSAPIDDGWGEESRSPIGPVRRRVLSDPAKALAISMANLTILAVTTVCLTLGFRNRDGSLGYLPANFGLFAAIEVAVVVVGLSASPFIRYFLDSLGLALRGAAGASRRPEVRTVVLPPRVTAFLLYVITAGSFIAQGVLIQETGGIIVSPFSYFLVALLVLAPYLMTRRATPILNFVLGLIFFGLLIVIEPEASRLDATPLRFVYLVIVSAIVVVSIGFYNLASLSVYRPGHDE